MKKTFSLVLIMTLLFSTLFNYTVFAGYTENTQKQSNTNDKQFFTNIINASHISATCSIDTNISSIDTNISSNSNNSIILIEFNDLASIDFNAIKNKIVNENYQVLIGYDTLANALSTYPQYGIKTQKLEKAINSNPRYTEQYNSNGYMQLYVEYNTLHCGGFFTTAQNANNILKNYNLFNGNLSYNIVEESVIETEIAPLAYTSGNYELQFYSSTSTTHNKIYSSPNDNSTRLTSLYQSEAIQNLKSQSTRQYYDEYGGLYTDIFYKVQVVTPGGSYQTGYFHYSRSYDPNNGDEGWWSGDRWYEHTDDLHSYLKSLYNEDYYFARTNSYVKKNGDSYGVLVWSNAGLYNSSGNWIREMRNNYIWISPSTTIKCGYSHPEYMSISGWSEDSDSSINWLSSTTFLDANLQTAHPADYSFMIRWWDNGG